METNKLKGFSLDKSSVEFLETITIKNQTFTINELITKFREQGLQVNFKRKFAELQPPTSAKLDTTNIEFLESVKVASFAFTLNCLIQTAKEQGLQL